MSDIICFVNPSTHGSKYSGLLNLSTGCLLIIYCLLNCVMWKQSVYLLKKCTTRITFYRLFSFCIDVFQRKTLTDITHHCLPTLATSPSSFVVNFNEKSLSLINDFVWKQIPRQKLEHRLTPHYSNCSFQF